MDNQEFKKQWSRISPIIRQKWTKLSDMEIKQINGDKTLLLNQLQKKYGFDRAIAEKELDHLVAAGSSSSGGTAGQKRK